MKEKDMKNNNVYKKESDLVTKESFCATFLLFSFLGFLILCTGEWIFGSFGQAICALFTGLVGYCAYPLLLLALYGSFTGLFGKKYLKNKKATLFIFLAAFFLALSVHTVQTTMSWGWNVGDNYLNVCLLAGEKFPAVTAAGWVGGLFVLLFSSLLSNVGALVLFSVLFLFSVYVTVVLFRKGERTEESAKEQPAIPVVKTPEPEIPMQGAQPMQAAQPVAQPMQAPNAPMYAQTTQRPGVTIPDEPMRKEGGFSPFGKIENMQEQTAADKNLETSYQNSREFLFAATPAENYKRNLIYQPSSNVNNLPPADANPPIVNSGYTPSYTGAYEDAVNENSSETPLKIVTDHAYGYNAYEQETAPTEPQAQSYERNVEPVQPLTPQPQEETPTNSFGGYFTQTNTSSYSSEEPQETPAQTPYASDFGRYTEERDSTTEELQSEEKQEGYRRHDYMDLFSSANPNVFGRVEDSRDAESVFNPFETRGDERENGREESRETDWNALREERTQQPKEEPTRDGLYLFDEAPEDNPYALRSDYLEQPKTSEDRYASENGYERENSREESVFEDTSRDGGYLDAPSALETGYREDRDVTPSFGFTDRVEEPSREQPPVESRYTEPVAENTTAQPVPEAPKPAPKKPRMPKPYKRISLDDLDCRDVQPQSNEEEVTMAKDTILATLEDFKVMGASIASVTFGPTVTRYNVTIPRHISPKKVVALDQSIAISLFSEGVNIYPNFEDGVVSIEVPNKERQFVQLGSMLSGDSYVNAKSSSLMFAMGKDVANRKIYGDISKMIHMLVAGASGSGKSVFLGALIISLIHKYSPEELRLILIDPKKTEFVLYNGLPHLMINEIITDVNKAVQSLNWAIEEMNRRYGLFEQMSRSGTYVVNLDQYNAQIPKEERLPKIVVIIDELADLMLAAKKDIEEKIQNLTQKARAAGIHLIVATQRPSTDVITGVIKSNLPTRIAFGVATDVDSRVILDQTGAQKLLGKGDFLYVMQGLKTPARVQSAFISPEDSQKVVNFIKANNEAYYDDEVTAYINNTRSSSSGDSGSRFDKDNVEPVYIEALRYVILNGSASISMIQRKCSAGYNKAGKIIEWMEEMEYISPFDGAKARKVLITKEEFEKKYGAL